MMGNPPKTQRPLIRSFKIKKIRLNKPFVLAQMVLCSNARKICLLHSVTRGQRMPSFDVVSEVDKHELGQPL